ncbi:MAG: alpha-L-rhamnosidase N-terminal domain-containing protein, partial [Oscillospiraceae bacterium]|nr:alpha-L-rhamnosidase N-terminal domain-containing protein [Oscillospiraceae bacterium]
MFEELKPRFIQADRPFREGAVDVFEQRFSAEGVKKACLMITALGVYEAELNGKKVGDILFAPGYTYYHRQLQAQSYDVTGMLREGENLLRVYLGQGWYCGRYTFDNKCQIYGEHTAVSWLLTLEDNEGSHSYASDGGNVSVLESPYEYAGLYDGEIYHARHLKPSNARVIPYTGKVPEVIEEGILYTKVQEKLQVQTAVKRGDVTILDFGQNFAGFIEIDPAFMKGDRLKLR